VVLFKNRGHFCNYCRKILSNKVRGAFNDYAHHIINPSIWYVWSHKEYMGMFLTQLKSLEFNDSIKHFNNELRAIASQFKDKEGYGNRFYDEHSS